MENKRFLTAQDVMEMLGVSLSYGLRHSHISLLINLGFSALAIGERVGHEAVDITYHYAHLFPTVQTDMAAQLETEREALINVRKE